MAQHSKEMPIRSRSLIAQMALHSPAALQPFMNPEAIHKLREEIPYRDALPPEGREATLVHYIHSGLEDQALAYLKRKKLDVNAADEVGLSLLHHAAGACMPKLAAALIARGADTNAMSAADESVLTYFLLLNAELPIFTRAGIRLHNATGHDDTLALAELLLKHGANPNQPDRDERTPAMVLAGIGDIKLIESFRQFNADFITRNDMGIDATFLAATGGHANVVRLFQEWGIDPRCKTADILSPRDAAESLAGMGGPDAYRFGSAALQLARGEVIAEAREVAGLPVAGQDLTRIFNDVNAFRQVHDNAFGRSDRNAARIALDTVGEMSGFEPLRLRTPEAAMFSALANRLGEVVYSTLENGANASATDEYGRTAMMVHVRAGGYEELSTLKNAGCNIDAQDCLLNTALHYAAVLGNVEAVAELLSLGATPVVKNWKGMTPRDALKDAYVYGPTSAFESEDDDDDDEDMNMSLIEEKASPSKTVEAVSSMLEWAELHWEVAGRKAQAARQEQAGPPPMVLH